MACEYYLDESGNSGDLVNTKVGLSFGNQPLFALACIGIENQTVLADVTDYVTTLKAKYDLGSGELKSQDLYFDKPSVILDLARFITKKRMPVLVELVDKRYCVAFSILSHQILPSYSSESPMNESTIDVLNVLADYLSSHLPDSCYRDFLAACYAPSDKTVRASMQSLRDFWSTQGVRDEVARITIANIDATIDDYQDMKTALGEEEAAKRFVPIPDTAGNGSLIKLLPHVHSIYSLFARINKYHQRDLRDVRLWHDEQEQFKEILLFCAEHIRDPEIIQNLYETQHADYRIAQPLILDFDVSENRIGIQLADLFAGFFNRYVNGFVYKGMQIADIYHEIFLQFRDYFRPTSPLAVNFVLPKSRRQVIFDKFKI